MYVSLFLSATCYVQVALKNRIMDRHRLTVLTMQCTIISDVPREPVNNSQLRTLIQHHVRG